MYKCSTRYCEDPMTERELIDAYLEGRIGSWGFVRSLIKVGLSLGTAISLAMALPVVARTGEVAALDQVVQVAGRAGDPIAMERLLALIGHALYRIGQGSNGNALVPLLAQVGVAVVMQPNQSSVPLNFDGNFGNVPMNLNGRATNLLNDPRANNANVELNLVGVVGGIPLNLNGAINVPAVQRPGVHLNLGKVNLNVDGAVGNVPINLNQNVGQGT